jgi:hypothetical protein
MWAQLRLRVRLACWTTTLESWCAADAGHTVLVAQKKHPYKMREVMSLRSMARGTGLTVGTASIVIYALFVSVQLRRKVRRPPNDDSSGCRDRRH